MKRIIGCICLILGAIIFASCSPSGNDTTNNIIYVKSMEMTVPNNEVTYYVGDDIKLDAIIKLSPWNANAFTFNFKTSQNSEIATYDVNSKTIKTLSTGTVIVEITAFTSENEYFKNEFTLNVISLPLYANGFCNENYNKITLNIDEQFNIYENIYVICCDNKIPLSNYEQKVLVNISQSSLQNINFDEVTGIVTPIKQGTSFVTVKAQIGANTYDEHKLEFNITENYYAKKFTVNNLIFNSEDYAVVNMLKGQKFILDLDIETYYLNKNYNLDVNLIKNSSNINIDFQNNKIIIEAVNETDITNDYLEIQVFSSKNTTISKFIYFNIIPEIEFEISLTDNNGNIFNEVFEGLSYILKVHSNYILTNEHMNIIKNYANLVNAQLELSNNENEFIITFNSNSAYSTIKLSLPIETFEGTINFDSNEINVRVYGSVTGYDITYKTNNGFINATNNQIELQLINESYYDSDNVPNHLLSFTIISLGNYVKENNYTLSIEKENQIYLFEHYPFDDLIAYNNEYTFKPTCTGLTTIIIKDNISNFEKRFIITTIECEVEKVELESKIIVLYVNGNESESGFSLDKFYIIPSYAYDTNLTFEVNNTDIAYVLDRYIVANNYGLTTLNVIYKNVVLNTFEIEVLAHPNIFEFSYNGTAYTENTFEIIGNNKYPIVLSIRSYYNEHILNKNFEFAFEFVNQNGQLENYSNVFLNSNEKYFCNNLTLIPQNSGVQKINICYGVNVIATINIKVFELIESVEFKNDGPFDFNLYENKITQFENKLVVNNNENSYYDNNAVIYNLYTNCSDITINSYGVVYINVNYAFDYEISAKVEAIIQTAYGVVKLNYKIKLLYILPYDEITSIDVENKNIKTYNAGNKEITIENNLIINNGNTENFNLNDIDFSINIATINAYINENKVVIVTDYIGEVIVTLYHKNNSEITTSYTILVEEALEINEGFNFNNFNAYKNYVLTSNITISGITIENFFGVLDGNGYTITLDRTLFFNINSNAVIKNLTINASNFKVSYNALSNFGILAVNNFGEIFNVTIIGKVDLDIYTSVEYKIGGLVFSNGDSSLVGQAQIINCNILVDFYTENINNTFRIGVIAFENYGIIDNCEVGAENNKLKVTNAKFVGGAIYNNYCNLLNTKINIIFTYYGNKLFARGAVYYTIISLYGTPEYYGNIVDVEFNLYGERNKDVLYSFDDLNNIDNNITTAKKYIDDVFVEYIN